MYGQETLLLKNSTRRLSQKPPYYASTLEDRFHALSKALRRQHRQPWSLEAIRSILKPRRDQIEPKTPPYDTLLLFSAPADALEALLRTLSHQDTHRTGARFERANKRARAHEGIIITGKTSYWHLLLQNYCIQTSSRHTSLWRTGRKTREDLWIAPADSENSGHCSVLCFHHSLEIPVDILKPTFFTSSTFLSPQTEPKLAREHPQPRHRRPRRPGDHQIAYQHLQ